MGSPLRRSTTKLISRPGPALVMIATSVIDDNGVSAQLAVGRLDQVDALVADGHGDGHALPLLMRGHRPLPHRHHLLLVEHRDLREGLNVGTLLLLAAAHLPQTNLVARVGRELGADEIADHGPDAMLPGVKLFQPGARLFGHGRSLPAEVVQLLHLAEEFDRIVHAVDAELQLSHIVGIDGDLRLFAGQVSALAGQREIGFGVGVLGGQRQDEKLEQEQKDKCAAESMVERRGSTSRRKTRKADSSRAEAREE